MKIDILHEPPVDIFKNKRMYTIIFIIALVLACCGLLLGLYAIFAETVYYDQLETVSLGLFVLPAVLVSFFGEKLQALKKLTDVEGAELTDMVQKHAEIKLYCDLVAKADRRVTFAEFEACQAWAADANLQAKGKNGYLFHTLKPLPPEKDESDNAK